MDFHAGLLIDDCEPLIDRLRKAAVPHFLALHFKTFVAVFFTDSDGSVFEVTCYRFGFRGSQGEAQENGLQKED